MERIDNTLNEDSVLFIDLDLVAIKAEIAYVFDRCSRRGLSQTSKWLAEINHALKTTSLPQDKVPSPELPPGPDLDTYNLAKTYFDLKEYDRAAFFTRNHSSPLCQFIHIYSRYMSAEKKRLDDLVDTVVSPDSAQLSHLKQLRVELEKLYASNSLDAYCLYVYGIVLRKLSLPELAVPVLCSSIRSEPGHWGAWLELSGLVTSREKLSQLDLPDHWCKHIFLAHTYLELQQNEQAVEIYFGLSKAGLADSTYIMAQVNLAVIIL